MYLFHTPNHRQALAAMAFLCLCCLLQACGDNENHFRITSDTPTQRVLDTGVLSIENDGGTCSLLLNNGAEAWQAELLGNDAASVSWCEVGLRVVGQTTEVTLSASANEGLNRRHATLRLSSGRQTKLLSVYQTPRPKMYAERRHTDVSAEGSNLFVVIHSNVVPHLDEKTLAPWLRFVEMKRLDMHPQANKDSMRVVCHFKVEPNADLGRLATIAFTNDSAGRIETQIHQWGRPLRSSEHINLDEPGQLATLLGGNGYDWRNLDSLTLTGPINTTDMQALRILLSPLIRVALPHADGSLTVDSECYLHLRHLDLGQCHIVGGGADYDERSIRAGALDAYVNASPNTLGYGAFNIVRTHLQSIVLPRNLAEIGSRAFYFCEYLERIDIPATVHTIGSYAFSNCRSIKAINIPANSQLRHLDAYALGTGSQLRSIRFPTTLEIVEDKGPLLGGASAQEIHLGWAEPPLLRRLGINSTTTLYVPRGSGNAYRAAAGWNRAKEIIEE